MCTLSAAYSKYEIARTQHDERPPPILFANYRLPAPLRPSTKRAIKSHRRRQFRSSWHGRTLGRGKVPPTLERLQTGLALLVEPPLLASPNLAAPRNVPPTPVKLHTTPRIAQPQTGIREPPMTAASDHQQMVRQPDQLGPKFVSVAEISGNLRKPAPTNKEHGKYMTSHFPAYPARCN